MDVTTNVFNRMIDSLVNVSFIKIKPESGITLDLSLNEIEMLLFACHRARQEPDALGPHFINAKRKLQQARKEILDSYTSRSLFGELSEQSAENDPRDGIETQGNLL